MMIDEDTIRCIFCGDRIVWVNYAMGPCWVHQPTGTSFNDDISRYCRATVATPPLGK